MRKIVTTIILLSMAIFSLYAASALTDEQVRQRDQKLEQLKQQFISATRFEGYVNYSYQNVTISEYIGNFPGVPLPATNDTLAVKTAATSIFNIMKPFIHASPDQLTITDFWISDNISKVTYNQSINGASFEYGGRLSIKFDHNRGIVKVMDGTHKISDNEPILVSQEQAQKIVKDERARRNYTTEFSLSKHKFEVIYSSYDHLHDNYPYRKYWRIGYLEGAYYVDCNTGKVSFKKAVLLQYTY